ncbi:uncharacterized protein EURHEDRAFT_528334 [Aspergillus ruber CBS 135680]|uniref:Uncharacterized protein n=1 Tax=Aspergillus ruber (strain CBS 135680) TaxID=1388766 RepID=A0A017SN51_ASPRC|nr:uncharacterized protein EURHEDRAFT_528334 [Aspergillus ruber CBS 135680]EYE98387.1 hypothetical protein EURHEDRAFT_528334 [Aspergillus ruber CBS 135680]
MFRRKRSSSQHQPLASPSQTAHSAASHAFLQSQPSSSNLSSAAAAAALRSLTPTPQPVENVQTKRIQRRASITSQPNLRAGQTHTLRRASSSSSMSNRTFRRDQSPGRPSTSQSHLINRDAPPLPSLPPGYTSPTPKPSPSSRRSVSVSPTMRTMSPPRRTNTRGMSVGPAVARSPTTSNGLGTVHELERSGSRNSINFSYPMASRPISPSPPPSPQCQHPVPTSLAEHQNGGRSGAGGHCPRCNWHPGASPCSVAARYGQTTVDCPGGSPWRGTC